MTRLITTNPGGTDRDTAGFGVVIAASTASVIMVGCDRFLVTAGLIHVTGTWRGVMVIVLIVLHVVGSMR
jgi:hypothetical protein